MTQYTITRNEDHNGNEIYFTSIPSAAVRAALKGCGYRWHSVKKCWYGRQDAETVEQAIKAAEDGETWQDIPNATTAPKGYKWQNNGKSRFSGEYKNRLVKAEEAPEAPKPERPAKAPKPSTGTPQNHIKIYYNGIKIDGGALIKCFYSVHENAVTIYARGYDSQLPAGLLPNIKNDTDLYTDYFDTDRATVDASHPLYKYFRFAALKYSATGDRRIIAKVDKKLAETLDPLVRKYYEDEKAAALKRLKDFEQATDPGQPTAEDLAKIDELNTAAENARKAAEQAEKQRQREIALNIRAAGRRAIYTAQEAHPVEEGQPTVTIEWSEHPGIEDNTVLSVPAAEIVLKTLDDKQHAERETLDGAGWYWKTSFRIDYTDPESGEAGSYTGRYDLGDGDGGLIAHIRAWGEWNRTHDAPGHLIENPEDTNGIIKFADYLATFCA